ncbi:MAG: 3D domain-containing protein [Armatimonadota bacterium]
MKLGSLLYVEGYGFAYAADTGGAIKGNRIDLCFSTNAQCNRFGRQAVIVHVLSSR